MPGNVAIMTGDGVIPPFGSLPRQPGTGGQHAWDVGTWRLAGSAEMTRFLVDSGVAVL